MPPPLPVQARERLESLDVLRGVALLGILAMNIRAMAAPFGAYVYPYALFDYEGASRAAFLFTGIVFDLKMMGLFSMLFGAGVLLYAGKATENGRPPTALWFRRMFWLLVIGLVHAYLIWYGDILVPYALCGMLVLWWARRLPAPALFGGALLFLTIGGLLGASPVLLWDSMSEADRARELEFWMPTPEVMRVQVAGLLGSYPDVVAHRAPFAFMAQTIFFATFFLWRSGGMMLLGMALYKWGFLDGQWSASAYRRVAAIGIPAGLLLAAAGMAALERIEYAMPQRGVADLWNYTGAVLASVGYAAAVVLMVKHATFSGLRRRLAAVGQMAFSNYLLQSVITSVLFLGWGFGLAGRLDYAAQLLVVVAIWALQLAVTPLWLARYQFGPAEWLWRSLTYGTRQPMRRESAEAMAATRSAT
jgi:uncharacterized protein